MVRRELSLAQLRMGESALVAGVEAGGDSAMRRRLMDLGLVEGTRVTCVGKSPAGDPAAYRFRGAVIALRAADAGRVRLDCVLDTQTVPLDGRAVTA